MKREHIDGRPYFGGIHVDHYRLADDGTVGPMPYAHGRVWSLDELHTHLVRADEFAPTVRAVAWSMRWRTVNGERRMGYFEVGVWTRADPMTGELERVRE